MRIGIHTSTGGSLERGAQRVVDIGGNCFQLFSSSPRMWRPSVRDPKDIRGMQRIRDKHGLHPVVVHDSYLINLASIDPVIRAQSVAAFRGEVERALAMEADYLVAHPGNYRGQSIEQGMLNVIAGLAEATHGMKSRRLTILLENTVGAGAQLGSRFEELAVMRKFAQERMRLRVAYCLDTAHCLACGSYDVSTPEGLRDTLRQAGHVLGLENVPVIHTNDSKVACGKCVDRHEHIGRGFIGLEGFRRILNHPKLRDKAFILETPVDEPDDDRRNLETLKSLCRRAARPRKAAGL